MTEADLQALIEDAAHLHGWLVFHDNDARRNIAGFPDLVLVNPPRVVFLELKSDKGRVRPEQQRWMRALEQCHTLSSAVVRPSDADDVLAYLSGHGGPL
jgi:hypothetical protein